MLLLANMQTTGHCDTPPEDFQRRKQLSFYDYVENILCRKGQDERIIDSVELV